MVGQHGAIPISPFLYQETRFSRINITSTLAEPLERSKPDLILFFIPGEIGKPWLEQNGGNPHNLELFHQLVKQKTRMYPCITKQEKFVPWDFIHIYVDIYLCLMKCNHKCDYSTMSSKNISQFFLAKLMVVSMLSRAFLRMISFTSC